MSQSKFYLCGALRDGSISSQYQIKVTQKNKEWLSKVIVPMFNNLFGINLTENQIYTQKDKNNKNIRYYLLFKNKRVWHYLRNEFEMPRNQKFWETPLFVRQAPKELVRFYIQGFFDAEGGVRKKVIAGSKIYLDFTQRSLETLEFIKEKLLLFGVKSGNVIISDKKSGSHRLRITEKKSILNFIKNIGTKHPEKRKRFGNIQKFLLLVREGEPADGSPP